MSRMNFKHNKMNLFCKLVCIESYRNYYTRIKLLHFYMTVLTSSYVLYRKTNQLVTIVDTVVKNIKLPKSPFNNDKIPT